MLHLHACLRSCRGVVVVNFSNALMVERVSRRRTPPQRRHGAVGIGQCLREPRVALTRQAREVVLPNMYFGDGGDAAGREEVNDVARAHLGRAEIESVLTTVGKVPVALAPSGGHDDGRKASEAV